MIPRVLRPTAGSSSGGDNGRQQLLVASAVLASGLVTAAVCCKILEGKNLRSHLKLEKKRQEERTGRIRAEVKLREALAKLKKANLDGAGPGDDDHVLPLSTIGIVRSPYPKRMGTPRQGALVPSSRGCIEFTTSLPPEVLDGIDGYSHLWVIFQFHENTSLATSRKTKIRPPRGGGIKVGQLATRSPHRPNPLGLSLVTIDRWEPSARKLYIKALDLVNGTPVYDVKPYVHWDIPNEVKVLENRIGGIGLKLPHWVENKGDVLASVVFEPEAEESLRYFVRNDKLSPNLYPSKDSMSFVAAKQTLIEILSQDPRSSHRGLSKNQRGSISSSSSSSSSSGGSQTTAQQTRGKNSRRKSGSASDAYRLSFGKLVIEFVVTEKGAVVKNIMEGVPPSSPNNSVDSSFDESTVAKGSSS
eukprot:CAMPEP_0197178780 /NCGR_PEP_ID=MMETSP1423-20130617/3959_1 /TAXON_ID=476441 /ORGANISM="Pseudo-nitzschia heimii, Strain UNC1101" /LENGTH=415 /DNA_ID=CAMNT_0042628593 /DNA_START=25 /DNA_END=1272 /DNA_ORIENTATION=-